MSWQVEIQRSAEKELKRVSGQARERIVSAVRNLSATPYPTGVAKLQNRDGYRIRVGDYRILYTIDAEGRTVRITAIGHRKDVYR